MRLRKPRALMVVAAAGFFFSALAVLFQCRDRDHAKPYASLDQQGNDEQIMKNRLGAFR
jgi:hypothetical protein